MGRVGENPGYEVGANRLKLRNKLFGFFYGLSLDDDDDEDDMISTSSTP